MEYGEVVRVGKKNETHLQVDCSPSVAYELNEYFSFESPGAKFDPRVRSRLWDGRIRLFGLLSRELYVGLYLHLHQFCKERGYKIEKVETEYGIPLEITPDITYENVEAYANSLELRDQYGESIDTYDFQLDAVFRGVKYQRRLFLSPTSSGKSLIIYLIIRLLLQIDPDHKFLLVVPRVGLVEQLHNDFKDYSAINGWDVDANVAKVYAGMEKEPKHAVTLTTWQSAIKNPPAHFTKYTAVIGDEAHEFKATSLVKIMSRCINAKFRLGTTGTLDGIPTNKLTLEGLFGPVHQVATTKELMDRGIVSQLKIKCVVLKHSAQECKENKGRTYPEEIEYLIGHEKRNQFIVKLAMAQPKNTMVLFQRVAKHGKILHAMLQQAAAGKRNVYYVDGKVEVEVREQIRKILETEDNAIICASYGTFSMGISIRNLHSIVFGSPYKSRIKVLQSIGRALRLHKDKFFATLFDIGDNLTAKEGAKPNFSLDHLIQRIDIYNSEQFSYTITEIPI